MQCASCGRQAERGEGFRFVVKTLPSGKHEEIVVCYRCQPLFREVEDLFVMLDGPTCTPAERSPFWCNTAPLPPLQDPKKYPLVEQLSQYAFPLIEDFEVLLEGYTTKHQQEDQLPPDYYAYFFSPSRGFLATLLFDSAQELSQPDFVIPHGDSAIPYDKLDQGWNMLVVEDHTFVYVITGNWEADDAHRTWFKVERNLYYRQWEKTIQRCRALCCSEI